MIDLDVSIIIACYNEEDILEENVREIQRVMGQTIYSYELIFIDDASEDKTRDLIIEITKNNPNMQYYFHKKNIGRGGTVIDGIKMAKGKIVGFLDIDLEVHARYIPSTIDAINSGYDVATGYRFYKVSLHPVSFLRHVLSIWYRRLAGLLLGLPLEDTETGYKFFNREKILPIIEKTENTRWFWDTEVMVLSYYGGLKIKEIPCLFIRRPDKKTSVKIFRDSFDYFFELWKFNKKIQTGKNRGILYWHPLFYRLFMKIIYGRNFKARYEAIAKYIPEGASVVDVCCGDCYLYHNYLKFKKIDYLGLDVNPTFIVDAIRKGLKARLFDIENDPLPKADYIILQACLYQFIPRQNIILDKIFNSATKRIIISEPIHNLSNSKNPIIFFMAKIFAGLLIGSTTKRFDEKSLMELFAIYGDRLKTQFNIRGGREKIGIFEI